MKKTIIIVFGIVTLVLTMFLNVSLFVNSTSSETKTLDMLKINISNAISESSQTQKCNERTGVETSRYGYYPNNYSNCYNDEGEVCGKCWDCLEDTSLPLLPPNQTVYCEIWSCI